MSPPQTGIGIFLLLGQLGEGGIKQLAEDHIDCEVAKLVSSLGLTYLLGIHELPLTRFPERSL